MYKRQTPDLSKKTLLIVDPMLATGESMELAWNCLLYTSKELGLNSETATVFNLKTNEQVILNTWYGGEMKKGMFSIMNYKNPLRGIASMPVSYTHLRYSTILMSNCVN